MAATPTYGGRALGTPSSSHSRTNSNLPGASISINDSAMNGHSSAAAANGTTTTSSSNDDILSDGERQLLIAHTVPELHAIEQKKRQQAEDKKEELRQLVGLRYRVLVQSADSIGAMESLTKSVVSNLSGVLQTLHQLDTNNADSWRRPTESDDARRVRTLQAYHRRVRQFAQFAELIWVDISHHRYMAACDTYMTACDVYPSLLAQHSQLFPSTPNDHHDDDHVVNIATPGTDNKEVTPPMLLTFLAQHYETIRNMPSLLIRQCQLRVLRSGLAVTEYGDALATLALLSHHNHLQSLSLFLRSRTAWLTRSISAAQRAFGQCNGDAERTLCHLLSSIALTFQCTISHASYLFPPATSTPSSSLTIKSSTGASSSSSSSISSIGELFNTFHQRRYAIRAASGTSSTSATAPRLDSITSSILRHECDAWYRTCVTLVREPVALMLTRATLGAQLGAIRDAVLATLSNYPSLDTPAAAAAAVTNKDEKATTPTPTPSTRSLQLNGHNEEKGDEKASSLASNTPNDEHRTTQDALVARERSRDKWQSYSVLVLGRCVTIWDDVFAMPFSNRARDVIRLAFERLALHTLLINAVHRIQSSATTSAAPTPTSTAVLSLASGATPSPLSTSRPLAISSSIESMNETKDGSTASTAASTSSTASSNTLSFVLWPALNGDTQPFALLAAPSIRSNDTSNTTTKAKPSSSSNSTLPSSLHGTLFGLHSDHVDAICDQFTHQLSGVMADVGLLLESSYLAAAASSTTSLASSSLSSPSTRLPVAAVVDPLGARAGGDFPSLYNNIERELRPYSRRMNVDAVERVNRSLNSRLDTIQEQVLDMMNPNDALPLVDEALFIGRVCARLASPPVVTKSTSSSSPSPSPRHVTPSTPSSSSVASDAQGAASAAFMYRTLQKTAHNAFRIWTRFVASTIADEQRRALSAWILQWAADDSLTVSWPKPDSVDGVPVPTECSPYASRLIFSFLHELTRVNGHHIPSRVLSWSLHDLATQLLRLLEDKLDVIPLGSDDNSATSTKLDRFLDDIPSVAANSERKVGTSKAASSKAPTSLRALSQAACLQLLFDLKFVFAVLRLPESSRTPAKTPPSSDEELGPFIIGTASDLRGRLDQVLAAVESGVDMIDYAASRDQLHQRLSSLLARTATLYGPLVRSNPFVAMHSNVIGGAISTTPSSRGAASSSSAPSSSPSVAMEVANILPLAAVTARIAPLPASLYPTKVSIPLSSSMSSPSSSMTDDFPSSAISLSSFDSGPFGSSSSATSTAAAAAPVASTTHSRSQSLAAGISGAWSSLLPPALPVRATTTRSPAAGTPAAASNTPSVSSFLGKLGLRV